MARLILGAAGPQMAVEVSLGGLRGNWITNLEIREVDIRHKSGSVELSADTVRIRHRLTGLPFGAYRIRSLDISGPRLDVARVDDGPEEGSDAAGGMAVRIDRFRVSGGRASAPNGVHVSGIEASGHAAVGPEPAVRIESLQASIWAPASGDSLLAQLVASFADGRLDLDTLRIQGSGTRAAGTGHFSAQGSQYDADLHFSAEPLVLSDFFSSGQVLDTVAVQVHLFGRGNLLRLQADAAAPDGGQMYLDVEGTPGVEGPVSWSIRRAESSGFHLPGIRTRITASATGRLAGPSLEESEGALRLSLDEAEIFGHALAPTSLSADLDSGRVSLALESGFWKGVLRAAGHVRPFDPVPAWSLAGRFSGIDAGDALASHQSALAGTFNLEGEGSRARASVELMQSLYNRIEVAGTRLEPP